MSRNNEIVIISAMNLIKDKAVVLRRLDYSENSQVLAVFTQEHGKVRILAKGIKKSTKTRFAPAMDLLDVGNIVLSAKTVRQEQLAILTEWSQSWASSELRTKLSRLYAAQYATALTSELTEDWDPHPQLFDYLLDLFRSLAKINDVLPAIVAFQHQLLREIGCMPITDACVGCHALMPDTGDIYFSSHEGGLLCRDCEAARPEKILVSKDSLAWLQNRVGEKTGLVDACYVFDYHASHLMGHALPLATMLLSACRQNDS